MDARGQIYMADAADVPAEDRARLDGYLRGRADAADLAEKRAARLAHYERQLRQTETERETLRDKNRP